MNQDISAFYNVMKNGTPKDKLSAIVPMMAHSEIALKFLHELWAFAYSSEMPMRSFAITALINLARVNESVFEQAVDRLIGPDNRIQVAAAAIVSRFPEKLNGHIVTAMRKLQSEPGLTPERQAVMNDIMDGLQDIDTVWKGSLAGNLLEHAKAPPKSLSAIDYALYFRAISGPAYHEQLLLWVMCPTSGLNVQERESHCLCAVEKVLNAAGSANLEYLTMGKTGFVINEAYFERGCTWKDLVFEPKQLRAASKEAFGCSFGDAEIPSQVIQIGCFRENSLTFIKRVGPASNSVPVNIEQLLQYGRRAL